MAISKSTPYVRYKKDFTSSLHLGTIHIESEYLDRTQKTTIESIHGMTWHNKVVNENKELNLLSDTQLELTELEKQYWNTGEKRVSVDEIHTLEEVEPNEDGTYTYTVNSMEGEYIEIYDGINNITSTSDGLDGQFEIVYDTTEEDVNGNIALDQVVSQYEITDSGVGAITSAKSTGLTLVNHITEPSKEEVTAIEQQEGRHFTIDNTVQGNIKSAILKGQTLVNLSGEIIIGMYLLSGALGKYNQSVATTPKFLEKKKYTIIQPSRKANKFTLTFPNIKEYKLNGVVNGVFLLDLTKETETLNNELKLSVYDSSGSVSMDLETDKFMILEGDYTENYQNIPYFEGMQSVKMPVLTTTGKNLFELPQSDEMLEGVVGKYIKLNLKPNTNYTYNSILDKKGNTSEFNFYGWISNDINSNFTGYEIFHWILNKTFSKTFNTGNDEWYFHILSDKQLVDDYRDYLINFQIEEGSIATEYEPYKSNILTVNEEVYLRKVNDVYDELDLLTGELTTNIREYVYTGSPNEQWSKVDNVFEIPTDGLHEATFGSAKFAISNKFEVVNYGTWASGDGSQSNVMLVETDKIKIKTNYSTIDEFRNQLLDNPLFIQVKSKEKSIKTVDLTVQNQDGGTIPHIQTQQGITHVSTSSDGLTPVVEMSCSYDTIIKPNTTYTIKLDRPIVSDTMYLQVDLGGTMMMLDADVNAFTIKTPSTLSHSQLRLSGTGNTVKEIIVLEGNRVNDKIEYFEGMKNVENPILVVSNCPYVFGKGGRL